MLYLAFPRIEGICFPHAPRTRSGQWIFAAHPGKFDNFGPCAVLQGILSTDPANITGERLKFMTDALAHRGPDGEAPLARPLRRYRPWAIRRLSIIDPSLAGAQPMACLDRYLVIHNGEIYNYIELREFLQSNGYSFSSWTDTEIIPVAYDFLWPDCVQHFDGMFSGCPLGSTIAISLPRLRPLWRKTPLSVLTRPEFLFASEIEGPFGRSRSIKDASTRRCSLIL